MSRPLYQTSESLARETEFARELSRLWGCRFEKLPIAYKVDFLMFRNDEPRAWCEVKCREYEMDQLEIMGGFMLSLAKWMEGKRLHEMTGLPFIVALQLPDGIWYHKPTDFKYDGLKIGGRKDRGDWQDVEPVILLQRDRFTRVR